MTKKQELRFPFGKKKANPLYETVNISCDEIVSSRELHSRLEPNLGEVLRDASATTGASDVYWSPRRSLPHFEQSAERDQSTNFFNVGEVPQDIVEGTESKRGTKFRTNNTKDDWRSKLSKLYIPPEHPSEHYLPNIYREGLLKEKRGSRFKGPFGLLGFGSRREYEECEEVASDGRAHPQTLEMAFLPSGIRNTESAEFSSNQDESWRSTLEACEASSEEIRMQYYTDMISEATGEQRLMTIQEGLDYPYIPDDISHEKVNGDFLRPTGEGDWPTEDFNQQGIAVASVVQLHDEPSVINAVEFDPDAKPPRAVQNTACHLYALRFIVAIVAVAIGLVIGQGIAANTRAPGIPYRKTVGIQENLELWLHHDIPDDTQSPYAKAFRWIAHDDPMRIGPADISFHQRFAIALFYFATSEHVDWSSDCAPTEFYLDSSVCRMELKVLGEGKHFPGRHWLSGSSECEWGGVLCDSFGQVVGLGIEAAGLNGGFPNVLALLPFLKYIYLGDNDIEGSLSSEFIKLQRHLIKFEMWKNRLTGPLPFSLFIHGQVFDVENNKLNGTVHHAMRAPNLKYFSVAKNEFTGALPGRIGDGKSVAEVILHNNFLSKSIPESYGLFGRGLTTLSLKNNGLTGTIPDSLGSHTLLKKVSLGSNKLHGTIPESLLGCSRCVHLKLENNMLTGTISASLEKAQELVTLDFSGNQLNGQVPEDIYTIPTLWAVYFEGNKLTGSVPSSLCSIDRSAYGPAPIEISSDCRRSPSGLVEIECACCTKCCEGDGRNCVEVD